MKYAERVRRVQKRRAAGLPKTRFALQLVQMKKINILKQNHDQHFPNSDSSFQTTDVAHEHCSPAAALAQQLVSKEFQNIDLSPGTVQSVDCMTNGIISDQAPLSKDDDEQQFGDECMRSLLKVLRCWEQKQERKRHIGQAGLAMELGNRNVMEVCAETLAQMQPGVQEKILSLI